MKIVILFMLLVFIFTSCEENTNTISQREQENASIIFVNIRKLGAEYEAWKIKNRDLIIMDDGEDIHINLKNIKDDDDNVNKANWLKSNGNKINYYQSSKYIKDSHIFSTPIVEKIKTLKIKEEVLIDKIGRNIYMNDEYNQYVKFTMGEKLIVEVIDGFDPDVSVTCLSIPFLRSMLGEYDGDDDSSRKLIFHEAKIDENENSKTVTIVEVREPWTLSGSLFNYTKWPTFM